MTDPTSRAPLGRTGIMISRLGFGTMALGGFQKAMSDDEARAVFAAAWDAGLRFYDTAPQYGSGLAEERLGALLKTRDRGDAVIATKVGKRIVPAGSGAEAQHLFPGGYGHEMAFDYSFDGTMRIVEGSLARLGLARLDLVLIHDVTRHFHGDDGVHVRFREAMEGAVKALQRLKSEGVIAAFGTGLKDVDIATDFAEHAGIDCVLVPGRLTLLEQSAATSGLLERCATLGVSFIAAAAFDSGILATGAVSGASYSYRPADDAILATVRRIEAICRDFGVALPAAALQFPQRHAAVAGILVGMRTPAEVEQDMAWMRAAIPEEFWQALARSGIAA